MKNQTGILNRKQAQTHSLMKLLCTIIKKRECLGSFCVGNLGAHSRQGKCCKFCKMCLLMQPNIMKQCLLLQRNVFNPHGNRSDGFSWWFRTGETNPVSVASWGYWLAHSRSTNIQIRRYAVAKKRSIFQWFPLRCHRSTVITARSITPCQREKCINTGYWQTPCVTHE